MNKQLLKSTLSAMATLAIATLGLGAMPTPNQSVKYATSVLLLQRIIQGQELHSYVKEVWRSPDAAAAPAVGTEYGRVTPYLPEMKNPECEVLVFEFGLDRPAGFPNSWSTTVTKNRRVPLFTEEVQVVDNEGLVRRTTQEAMHVEDVRARVKRNNPKPEKPKR